MMALEEGYPFRSPGTSGGDFSGDVIRGFGLLEVLFGPFLQTAPEFLERGLAMIRELTAVVRRRRTPRR